MKNVFDYDVTQEIIGRIETPKMTPPPALEDRTAAGQNKKN